MSFRNVYMYDPQDNDEIEIDYNYIIENKPDVEEVRNFLRAQIDDINYEEDNKFEINNGI